MGLFEKSDESKSKKLAEQLQLREEREFKQQQSLRKHQEWRDAEFARKLQENERASVASPVPFADSISRSPFSRPVETLDSSRPPLPEKPIAYQPVYLPKEPGVESASAALRRSVICQGRPLKSVGPPPVTPILPARNNAPPTSSALMSSGSANTQAPTSSAMLTVDHRQSTPSGLPLRQAVPQLERKRSNTLANNLNQHATVVRKHSSNTAQLPSTAARSVLNHKGQGFAPPISTESTPTVASGMTPLQPSTPLGQHRVTAGTSFTRQESTPANTAPLMPIQQSYTIPSHIPSQTHLPVQAPPTAKPTAKPVVCPVSNDFSMESIPPQPPHAQSSFLVRVPSSYRPQNADSKSKPCQQEAQQQQCQTEQQLTERRLMEQRLIEQRLAQQRRDDQRREEQRSARQRLAKQKSQASQQQFYAHAHVQNSFLGHQQQIDQSIQHVSMQPVNGPFHPATQAFAPRQPHQPGINQNNNGIYPHMGETTLLQHMSEKPNIMTGSSGIAQHYEPDMQLSNRGLWSQAASTNGPDHSNLQSTPNGKPFAAVKQDFNGASVSKQSPNPRITPEGLNKPDELPLLSAQTNYHQMNLAKSVPDNDNEVKHGSLEMNCETPKLASEMESQGSQSGDDTDDDSDFVDNAVDPYEVTEDINTLSNHENDANETGLSSPEGESQPDMDQTIQASKVENAIHNRNKDDEEVPNATEHLVQKTCGVRTLAKWHDDASHDIFRRKSHPTRLRTSSDIRQKILTKSKSMDKTQVALEETYFRSNTPMLNYNQAALSHFSSYSTVSLIPPSIGPTPHNGYLYPSSCVVSAAFAHSSICLSQSPFPPNHYRSGTPIPYTNKPYPGLQNYTSEAPSNGLDTANDNQQPSDSNSNNNNDDDNDKELPKKPVPKNNPNYRHITVQSIVAHECAWVPLKPADTGKSLAERIRTHATYHNCKITNIKTSAGKHIPIDDTPLFESWKDIESIQDGERWTFEWAPQDPPILRVRNFFKMRKS